VTSGAFTLSWVSDQKVNGTIEYCQSGGPCSASALGGNVTAHDPLEFLASGASMARATFLDAGTTYFYRALARNEFGETTAHPASPPYPSVTTKTVSAPGELANPVVRVRPYRDVNGNDAYDPGTDAQLPNFLVYLNHSAHSGHPVGSVPMVARGDTVIAQIDTKNLRNADASGNNHLLSSGSVITFFIAGLYDDGTGLAFWKNDTASYTISGAPSPIDLDRRAERQAPEAGIAAVLAAVAAAAPLLAGSTPAGRGLRRCFRPSAR
jgi:hypothetical protein